MGAGRWVESTFPYFSPQLQLKSWGIVYKPKKTLRSEEKANMLETLVQRSDTGVSSLGLLFDLHTPDLVLEKVSIR